MIGQSSTEGERKKKERNTEYAMEKIFRFPAVIGGESGKGIDDSMNNEKNTPEMTGIPDLLRAKGRARAGKENRENDLCCPGALQGNHERQDQAYALRRCERARPEAVTVSSPAAQSYLFRVEKFSRCYD